MRVYVSGVARMIYDEWPVHLNFCEIAAFR